MSIEIVTIPNFWKSSIYNHATKYRNLLFTAGTVAFDPETGSPVSGDIKIQTKRVLENLKQILEAAGTTLDHTIKVTIYLRKWEDLKGFNEIYMSYFPTNPPRTTTQAGRLGGDYLVEIELVVAIPEST
jgi:2-iminobutanoate/2-iminopropanoate deaminase